MNDRALKILLFYCSNSLDTDALRRCCSERGGDDLKTIPLPCSGKVDVPYLIKAFETGADGAILVTCMHGECKYLEGNLRAHRRAQAVDSLLEEIGLGRGRMVIIQQKEDGGVEHIIDELENLSASIRIFSQAAATAPL
jgi:coenzyme F420-reducing hydrogenase delta subunit